VYSVAKEMIIMKRGVLVGKFGPQRAQREVAAFFVAKKRK
jgi:hypothetical protein